MLAFSSFKDGLKHLDSVEDVVKHYAELQEDPKGKDIYSDLYLNNH